MTRRAQAKRRKGRAIRDHLASQLRAGPHPPVQRYLCSDGKEVSCDATSLPAEGVYGVDYIMQIDQIHATLGQYR